jgi:hypothetical protein
MPRTARDVKGFLADLNACTRLDGAGLGEVL